MTVSQFMLNAYASVERANSIKAASETIKKRFDDNAMFMASWLVTPNKHLKL
jgi:hypothetical protein